MKPEEVPATVRFVWLVHKCSRCGFNHEIEFQPVLNPVDEYNFYGICENTHQPIFAAVKRETVIEGKARDKEGDE